MLKQSRSLNYLVIVGLLFVLTHSACRSTKGDTIDIELPNEPRVTTTRTDAGIIVQRFDAHGNDNPDIIKYFEEYPDEDNPAIMHRVLRKMELDVNGDSQINIRRIYDEDGSLTEEYLDSNLDGHFNTVNYFDHALLVKKEILEAGTQRIIATHYYAEGTILRVEKDTNLNGKVDYWEIYEEGVLDRIGRDLNGDGVADSWRRRE